MRLYLETLNGLSKAGLLDFDRIETWWVGRVREFFSAQPLRIKVDASKSLRGIVSDLIQAAIERQKACPGTMIAGAVMQHLVGAKLQLALPNVPITHEGFSIADAPGKRKGDFLVNDTAIHVTTAPSEALLRKCKANLDEKLRPVIITTELGAAGAKALSTNLDIAARIDILEIEQFIATNVYEWSGFQQSKRQVSVEELIREYNKIIERCETDPSLKISTD
jgi:hypothetical protein